MPRFAPSRQCGHAAGTVQEVHTAVLEDHGDHGGKSKSVTRHSTPGTRHSAPLFGRFEAEPENLSAGIIRAFSPVKLQGDAVKVTKDTAAVRPKIPGHDGGVDLPGKPEALQDGIVG